jgi:hypothetical protein
MTLDGVRAAAAAPSDVEERAADVIKINAVDKSDSFHDVMTRGMLGRRMKQGEKMRCPAWQVPIVEPILRCDGQGIIGERKEGKSLTVSFTPNAKRTPTQQPHQTLGWIEVYACILSFHPLYCRFVG